MTEVMITAVPPATRLVWLSDFKPLANLWMGKLRRSFFWIDFLASSPAPASSPAAAGADLFVPDPFAGRPRLLLASVSALAPLGRDASSSALDIVKDFETEPWGVAA